MGHADHAVDLFRQGYSCSQAVVLPWSEQCGLDESSAARLAAPFAAGVHLGTLCGALTGAIMVIGLATCDESCVTREGRAGTIGPSQQLAARFAERCGALDCPGVIGCDLRELGARERALEDGLFASRCAPAVRAASEILEDLLGPS